MKISFARNDMTVRGANKEVNCQPLREDLQKLNTLNAKAHTFLADAQPLRGNKLNVLG